MKKCKTCNIEYSDDVQYCINCGTELSKIENAEEDTITNTIQERDEKTFCIYCGGDIDSQKHYCTKCGKSSIIPGQKHCIHCGEILLEKQKFCAKCGEKVTNIVIPKELDDAKNKLKKIDTNGLKKYLVIGVVGVLLAVSLITFVPKLFVSHEQYLSEGNYTQAYKKASKSDKESVLIENLIAVICAEAKDNLKNPESFKLRDGWYDKEDNKIVLSIQGTNSYGGDVASYWYYTFDKSDVEYQLYTTMSDFDEEKTYSWDDTSEYLEKILKNAAKKTVKEIISDDSNKLDKSLVKRINELNDNNLLDSVEIIEETKTLYPLETV